MASAEDGLNSSDVENIEGSDLNTEVKELDDWETYNLMMETLIENESVRQLREELNYRDLLINTESATARQSTYNGESWVVLTIPFEKPSASTSSDSPGSASEDGLHREFGIIVNTRAR